MGAAHTRKGAGLSGSAAPTTSSPRSSIAAWVADATCVAARTRPDALVAEGMQPSAQRTIAPSTCTLSVTLYTTALMTLSLEASNQRGSCNARHCI